MRAWHLVSAQEVSAAILKNQASFKRIDPFHSTTVFIIFLSNYHQFKIFSKFPFMGKRNTELNFKKKKSFATPLHKNFLSSSFPTGEFLSSLSGLQCPLRSGPISLCSVSCCCSVNAYASHTDRWHTPCPCLSFKSPATAQPPNLPNSKLILLSYVTSAARLGEASIPSLCGSAGPGP